MSENSDQLISTHSWTESQCPFTTEYTVQHYQRPNGSKYKTTTKKVSGPPAAIERQKWKKFGNAATDDGIATSSVGTDVFFEPVKRKIHTPVDNWRPNGVYLKHARNNNWSDQEIRRIVKSDRPDIVYMQIFRTKLEAAMAEVRMKAIAEGKILPVPTPVAPSQDKPASAMGLRERMMMKQQQRLTEAKPNANPNTSLSARMNQRQSERQSERQSGRNDKSTLFLENVPDNYTEADIKQHIGDFSYRRVNVVRREGQSTGKAFIELDSEDEATECLNTIDGQRWEYCVISAQFSKPKP